MPDFSTVLHNCPPAGPKCRHCENETVFHLWGLTREWPHPGIHAESRTFDVPHGIHQLIATRRLGVAAQDIAPADVCDQFNQTNGGEWWLTFDDEPAPWVARRTTRNADGSEPELWAFFVADQEQGRLYRDATP